VVDNILHEMYHITVHTKNAA